MISEKEREKKVLKKNKRGGGWGERKKNSISR